MEKRGKKNTTAHANQEERGIYTTNGKIRSAKRAGRGERKDTFVGEGRKNSSGVIRSDSLSCKCCKKLGKEVHTIGGK